MRTCFGKIKLWFTDAFGVLNRLSDFVCRFRDREYMVTIRGNSCASGQFDARQLIITGLEFMDTCNDFGIDVVHRFSIAILKAYQVVAVRMSFGRVGQAPFQPKFETKQSEQYREEIDTAISPQTHLRSSLVK